jgi:Chalcone isomerase-like
MRRIFEKQMSGKIFFICLAFILILGVQTTAAREIAGIDVPETAAISNIKLVLNGAGIRKKFFVKIYVGALYLTAKRTTVEQILSDSGAKRIIMSFLYKEVGAEKLVDGWNEGFHSNNSAVELNILEDRIRHFNSLFITVRKGDVIRLDYLPDQGTQVWINEELRGSVAGEDFYRALLKIWLGKEPADGGLKRAMLGNTD